MKFWGSRKNKICFMLLLYVLIQGLALGQHVYADTVDKAITNYKYNNTTYNQNLRIMYGNPVMIESMDNNGTTNYLWETQVSINIPFPMDNGYYTQFTTLSIPATWSTNSTVYNVEITDYENTDNTNVSLYNYLISGGSRTVTANFRVYSKDTFYRNSSSATQQIVTYKLKIWTTTNITPVITFGNVSSYVNFYTGKSEEEIILEALNDCQTAVDVANILTLVRADNTLLQRISNILGANYNLETVQEYAYRIWDILNNAYPSTAKDNLDNAESSLSDINDDIQQYTPPTVDANDVNTNANNSFQQMNIEGDSNNLFFYLNWSSILPILTLIFSLAILSYVLYGGK